MSALGGATIAWPLAARGQQAEHMRHIGIIMGLAESDPIAQARVAAFTDKLRELGWVAGRNTKINILWTAGEAARAQSAAKELVELNSDVIVAHSIGPARALVHETTTIPVVFTTVSDPNAAGLVESLSARAECYRLHKYGADHGIKMARTAQADRASHHAGRSHLQSRGSTDCNSIFALDYIGSSKILCGGN